jgi:hypothetical protein
MTIFYPMLKGILKSIRLFSFIGMKKNIHRAFALTLVVLFTVFNVGIPIVLASCPMLRAGNSHGSCCPSASRDRSPSLTMSRDYSCCRTVIAAGCNTMEFLAARAVPPCTASFCFAEHPAQQPLALDNSASVLVNVRYHSPPLILDLPLITSALLI